MKKPFILFGLVKNAFGNLKILRLLWRDFRSGHYPTVPIKAIAAIGLFCAYILNPFDFFSDFIPLWGQLDDLGVFMFCLYLLDKETSQYQFWLSQNN